MIRRINKKKFVSGEGYIEIQPTIKGSHFIYPDCVMCEEPRSGRFIAPETKEPLCLSCLEKNNAARFSNL